MIKRSGIISSYCILAILAFGPCVRVFALGDIFKEWDVSTANSGPGAITVYDGLVYFTEYWVYRIGCLDPVTGIIREWTIPTVDSGAYGIAIDDGLIYFTEDMRNKIGRLDPATNTFKEWDIPTVDSYPSGIAIYNGQVYFSEDNGNKIGRLDPSTDTFREWDLPTANSGPTDIAIENGLIYFTERWVYRIGCLDPVTGIFKEWGIPRPGSVLSIAISSNQVYFTESDDNKIGRLDPSTGTFREWEVPTAKSRPLAIAVSNGLIFFTESDGNKIGRLDPSTGEFEEWDIPTARSGPGDMAVSNGLVYFTEFFGNKIGLLTLNPLQVEFETFGQGIAVWTTEENHSWTYSVKLMIPDGASFESWAAVKVQYGKTLSKLSPPSFSILYTTAHPRFALYLDKNGDDEVDDMLLSDYLIDGSGEWVIRTGGLRWGWTEVPYPPYENWGRQNVGKIWHPYEYWQNVYGNVSVLYVTIALEYGALEGNATKLSGFGKPLYVDDITINGVTYILTATNIATLTIQVVGAQGQALNAPQVEIENSGGTIVFSGLANEQGVVSIRVLYGTYTVNVNYKGFTNSASTSVNSPSGTVQTMAIDVFIEFEPFGPMTFETFVLWMIIIVFTIILIVFVIRKLLHRKIKQ